MIDKRFILFFVIVTIIFIIIYVRTTLENDLLKDVYEGDKLKLYKRKLYLELGLLTYATIGATATLIGFFYTVLCQQPSNIC